MVSPFVVWSMNLLLVGLSPLVHFPIGLLPLQWQQTYFFLCAVLSTSTNPWPGFWVGGRGLPSIAVISVPTLPPFGPTGAYWPESGALVPGFKISGLLAILITTFLCSSQNMLTPNKRRIPRQSVRSRPSMAAHALGLMTNNALVRLHRHDLLASFGFCHGSHLLS